MNNTLKTTPQQTRFIHSTSINHRSNTHNTQKPSPNHYTNTRTQSQLGSLSYQESLKRAYTRAKLLAFFNPDLTQFITLTYKENQLDHQTTLHHLKQFFKYQKNSIKNRNTQNTHSLPPHKKTTKKIPKPKYIYVFERQKRGAIHVHMLSNDSLQLETNKNGHLSVKYWPHGYSSVLLLQETDINFKPYLYLFKYMTKTERIGPSFIHTSRNVFDNIENVDYRDYIKQLDGANVLYEEDLKYIYDGKTTRINKKYLEPKRQET